jgi:hypothetical protein
MNELGRNLCAGGEPDSKFRFKSPPLFVRGLVWLNSYRHVERKLFSDGLEQRNGTLRAVDKFECGGAKRVDKL